ncbi:MAG: ATP-binding protein [Gemmatimonadetes bacterium]|nr:ATP-binding protein [Gemmatimonadota bacterium]
MTRPLLPRAAAHRVAELMRVFPVTVVTGARQTGKSTLVRQPEVTGERVYLTMDDVLVRDQAQRDAVTLLERADRLVLDEVQRVPDLLLAIKRAVDERRVKGRFVLTGSANLLLMERISESLAGRAGYVTLWPLTRREQLGLGVAGVWSELLDEKPRRWRDVLEAQVAPDEPWQDVVRRGGYPVAAYELTSPSKRRDWFDGYTLTYLERDLRQVTAIDNLADARRLMTALALRVGRLLNQAEVSRDLGLPASTVHRHINVLEVSCQLIRLSAYAVNRTKRLMKSPKVYWSDTGLALHLAGDIEPNGRHLENLIVMDLLAWASLVTGPVSVLHWRTQKGLEVDLVVETPQRLLPVEVKAARRVSVSDARHLEQFLDDYADLADAGLLLYTGDETFWLTRRVLVVPWSRVI